MASSQPIANTDIRLPNGQIWKAGTPAPAGVDLHSVTQTVDPNFRGQLWSNTLGSDIYKQQTGQDFQSLPEFNMADIQTVLQRNNGTLPAAPVTEKSDPAIAGYTNPNANFQNTGSTAGFTVDSTGNATQPTAGNVSTGTTTTGSAVQPPTTNLQPGMTGDGVKQLQDWLVSQGYLTREQVNTGYGTYGPQTTAAVAKWQTDHGVDNASGPGYWGPKSIAASTTASGTSATGTSASGTTTTGTSATGTSATGTSSDNPLAYNSAWDRFGMTQAEWNQLNPTQQAVVGASLNTATQLYSTNASKITLADALQAAASDPNLLAKYADAAKIDTAQLQQGLQYLQESASTNAEQQQRQFENDRRQLAEQQGAAGTAYSGFRQQAQKQLADTQAGIVRSSRATLQKQLNDATSQFEAKYGTGATTPASATFKDPYAASNYTLSGLYKPSGGPANTLLTGVTLGGITGTQPIAKQNDINSLAGQYVNLGETPKITPIPS